MRPRAADTVAGPPLRPLLPPVRPTGAPPFVRPVNGALPSASRMWKQALASAFRTPHNRTQARSARRVDLPPAIVARHVFRSVPFENPSFQSHLPESP
jgi:hypothetical protein